MTRHIFWYGFVAAMLVIGAVAYLVREVLAQLDDFELTPEQEAW